MNGGLDYLGGLLHLSVGTGSDLEMSEEAQLIKCNKEREKTR